MTAESPYFSATKRKNPSATAMEISSSYIKIWSYKKEEAYKLSRKLNVSINDLPREISNAMSHYEKINCPEPSDVRDCFREITECIVEEGCKFKMIKTP